MQNMHSFPASFSREAFFVLRISADSRHLYFKYVTYTVQL